MGFLDSMNISASALTATRLRMDTVAENIANVNTTRTASGEPYRRKYVVFQEIESTSSKFSDFFNRAEHMSTFSGRTHSTLFHRSQHSSEGGVRVQYIGEDSSDFKLDYDPTHPDADEEGYVRLPNVEVVQEMTDMMSAYRAYEANITALNTFKDMAVKTLELGR